MMRISKMIKRRPIFAWGLFLATMAATFVLGLFATSIMERRTESRARFQVNTVIDTWESDSEKWKSNYPREYARWAETTDSTFKSKYGGSAKRDLLEEHPEMVVLWAGYAFAREYNQSRGHANTVEDVRNVLRTAPPQPGTCWTCKGSDVPRLMNEMGIKEFYHSTWKDLGSKVKHSVGCLDCHDPKTNDLRISRPALKEAFERQGKDVAKATPQEMRSLVCAQCHVEYYFRKEKPTDEKGYYLTFPWDKGSKVEDMEKYYDEVGHADWVHALSKTPMLKAQHPDFELAQQGIHAQKGVGCADCHMPYRSEGGVKITDHKIDSPLAHPENTCQVCHMNSAPELVKNAYNNQDKIFELRKRAQEILARAHIETKVALDKGATEAEIKPVQLLIRHAQWRWDFTAASIGGSFHAPLESARILSHSIEKGQEARLLLVSILAKHGVTDPIPLPDISTKAKAQKYIGLDMDKLNKEKQDDLKGIISTWGPIKL